MALCHKQFVSTSCAIRIPGKMSILIIHERSWLPKWFACFPQGGEKLLKALLAIRLHRQQPGSPSSSFSPSFSNRNCRSTHSLPGLFISGSKALGHLWILSWNRMWHEEGEGHVRKLGGAALLPRKGCREVVRKRLNLWEWWSRELEDWLLTYILPHLRFPCSIFSPTRVAHLSLPKHPLRWKCIWVEGGFSTVSPKP